MIFLRFIIFATIGKFMTILAKEQGLNFEELYREEGELLAAVNAWILNFDVNNWLFDSQKKF